MWRFRPSSPTWDSVSTCNEELELYLILIIWVGFLLNLSLAPMYNFWVYVKFCVWVHTKSYIWIHVKSCVFELVSNPKAEVYEDPSFVNWECETWQGVLKEEDDCPEPMQFCVVIVYMMTHALSLLFFLKNKEIGFDWNNF